MNLEVRYKPLAGGPLARQYLAGDPSILRFFAAEPFELSSFEERYREVQSRFEPEARRRAAAALRPTSERARQRLAHFVERGGAVVTTGQQAGLFTGPLYTVYKILTAVRLAEALEASLGITVLPVFWVASEDHDWAEVDHTHLTDPQGGILRIAVDSEDKRPLPMSERRLGKGIEAALDAAAQLLAQEPHAADYLELLRTAYLPGATVGGAFREVVESIFAPFDILVADAADAALKAASAPVLRAELQNTAQHEAVLRDTAAELARSRLPVQVPVIPGASNLFLRTARGRERLFREGSRWSTRETRERHTEGELARIIADEPARVSPNVLLRPVVESALFPVLAYVGGPGEISYFAQLKPLFAAHGIGMPLVFPRASFSLVEPRVRRALETLQLDVDALTDPPDLLLTRHARAHLPMGIQGALAELRESLVTRFDDLARASAAIDPTLRGSVESRRNRALAEAAAAEKRILRGFKRQQREWSDRLEFARAHLAPGGTEQERVLNVIPYLARYGGALLGHIAARIPILWRNRSIAPAEAAEELSGLHPAGE